MKTRIIFKFVTEHLDKVEKDLKGLEGKLADLASQFKPVAKVGAVVGAGFLGVAGMAIKSGARLEYLRTTIINLSDSVEEGMRDFNTMYEIFKETPFELEEMAQATATLKAFRLDVETFLPRMADLASAFGRDIPEASRAFAKAWQAGASAMDALRESYGVTASTLARFGAQLDKSGKLITSTRDGMIAFRKALLAWVDEQAGGSKALASTIEGLMSTIRGNFMDLQATVIEGSMPAIKEFLEKVNELITRTTEWVRENKDVVNTLIKVGARVSGIAIGLGVLTVVVPKVVTEVKKFTKALKVLMLTNPLGIVVISAMGLYTILGELYKRSEDFRIGVEMIKAVGKSTFEFLSTVVGGFFKAIFLNFKKLVKVADYFVKGQRDKATKLLGQLGNDWERYRKKVHYAYESFKADSKEWGKTAVTNAKSFLEAGKKSYKDLAEMQKEYSKVIRKAVDQSIIERDLMLAEAEESKKKEIEAEKEKEAEKESILMGGFATQKEMTDRFMTDYISLVGMMGEGMQGQINYIISGFKSSWEVMWAGISTTGKEYLGEVGGVFYDTFSKAIAYGQSVRKSLKGAFADWARSAIAEITKVIAKMMMMKAIGFLAKFTPFGGFFGMLGFQTPVGMYRVVPAGLNKPVPVIAHGGEIIGRPAGGIKTFREVEAEVEGRQPVINITVGGNIMGSEVDVDRIAEAIMNRYDLLQVRGVF
jgi:hypothetical protein